MRIWKVYMSWFWSVKVYKIYYPNAEDSCFLKRIFQGILMFQGMLVNAMQLDAMCAYTTGPQWCRSFAPRTSFPHHGNRHCSNTSVVDPQQSKSGEPQFWRIGHVWKSALILAVGCRERPASHHAIWVLEKSVRGKTPISIFDRPITIVSNGSCNFRGHPWNHSLNI